MTWLIVKRIRCQDGPGFCKLKTGQIRQNFAPSSRDQPILCDYYRCNSVEEGDSLDAHQESLIRAWATASNFPATSSSLDAINLDEQVLPRESVVFPRMKFNLEPIDFYLDQKVFPKEGKGFTKRLSASGWDTPSPTSSQKLLTTDFSGTDDTRVILRYSIQQRDLDELLHTDAMVLDLILR